MKFDPNKHQTQEAMQLSLIDQGYAHGDHDDTLDAHPANDFYGPDGTMTDAAKERFGLQVPPREVTPKEVMDTARIALGPLYTLDARGNVLSPAEADNARTPDSTRERVGRY